MPGLGDKRPQLRTLCAREVVRSFVEAYPCCTRQEIAYGTGLTKFQVEAACKAIRAEWPGKIHRVTDSEAVERAMDIIQSLGLVR